MREKLINEIWIGDALWNDETVQENEIADCLVCETGGVAEVNFWQKPNPLSRNRTNLGNA